MSTTHTVVLPFPSRDLSPNGRVHWRKKHKATRAMRAAVQWCALEAKLPRWHGKPVQRVEILLEFYPAKRGIRYDRDNLLASMKAALDGLAEYMGMDDNLFYPSVELKTDIGGMVKAHIRVVEDLPEGEPC